MTETDIRLIRASFAKIVPIAPTAAQLFYARLFEIAPETKPLFRGDMAEQGAKLMAMLGTVVASLDRLDQLVPAAQGLARRHVQYGVQPAHYAPVGEALIDTLARGLGEDFDPDTRASWLVAYGTLSSVMIAAAYPEAA
jgi:hemoglobin-like flavoprotein